MMKNFSFMLMVGLLTIGMLLPTVDGQANAAHLTILVVSDRPAVASSHSASLDAPLVTFLQGLDYTVDTSGMNGNMLVANGGPTSATNAAAIAAADIVLMTRATSSAGNNDPAGWNAVAKPMLLMNPFLARGGTGSAGRLGWMTGTGIATVSNTETDLVITDPVHPYVAGLTSPAAIFDWTIPATGGLDQLPSSADLLPGSSEAGTLDGRVFAFSIPAGTTTGVGDGSTFAGPRGFVAAWSYPSGANGGPTDFGAPAMTADYNTLLGNAISTLIIPEPSSGMLLMLGSAAFGVVRRRRNG